MKRVLKNVLLACLLPIAGVAAAQAPTLPDPVAYKCFLCTPEEMRDVALSKGVGVQYVYDFEIPEVIGFRVEMVGGALTATPFDIEPWIKRQFKSMVESYSYWLGLHVYLQDAKIYASGSDHARSSEQPFVMGHHLSALHPDHLLEREKVQRYLQRHAPGFLQTHDSSGRLLRLEFMQPGSVMAEVRFYSGDNSSGFFHFDYGTRTWVYQRATDVGFDRHIQERADDFVTGDKYTYHFFEWLDYWFAEAFVTRAGWAGIPVSGTLRGSGSNTVICSRDETLQIQCEIQ